MNYMNINKTKTSLTRGFVLPFTLLICSIILSIATAISIILVKELYFSKLSRDSQIAYYAADNGLECAIAVDDSYTNPATGLGIFESVNTTTASDVLTLVNEDRQSRGLSAITLTGGNSIKCATSEIFNPTTNEFTTQSFTRTNSLGDLENGRTSRFTLRMNLGNGTERCAKVSVNKTATYRQIISQGYTTCPGGVLPPVERAVVSTSEIVDSEPEVDDGIGQVVFTTSGTWVAPAGVTRVSVLAIGGGGAGGAAPRGGGGGGGGGLGYNNTVTVVPGNSYTVVVGARGVGVVANDGGDGGDSYFINTSTVRGSGGKGGDGTNWISSSEDGGDGGNNNGDGGGGGGKGDDSSSSFGGGGGGAGGYSGDGGDGDVTGLDGQGGGGAGGSRGSGTTAATGAAQSGGGTGILGSGLNGNFPGDGGSGGSDGSNSSTSCTTSTGGTYGGGGGGQADTTNSTPGCNGGSGVVRIIWPGDVRRFPTVRTADE